MKPNNDTPSIRFTGFTDAWEQRKLGEVCGSLEYGLNAAAKEYDGENKYIRITDIDDNTRIFLTSDLTSPDTNLKDAARYRLEAGDIVFARTGASVGKSYIYKRSDGTVYYAGFLIRAKVKQEYYADFVFQNTLSQNYEKYILITSQRSGQPGVNAQEYAEYTFSVPEYEEQKKIGTFLTNLDGLITLHQRKYDQLVNIKKSMLEKMFPKNGELIPEVRFAGFTDAWEQRECGELMEVTSVRRIHQSDWKTEGIRFLRARDIVAAIKNEEVSDYLYISEEKYEECSKISGKVAVGDLLVTGVGTIGVPYLISNNDPVYFKDGNIIWFKNNNAINGTFFYYSFISVSIQNFISESAGIGTVGTYTIETGKKTPIALPNHKEQQKIGSYFANLDTLITLHQRKLERLQNIKKACLEKMFV